MSHDELKDRIVLAFKEHFFHYGFKKTSVDDVAAELKISKKTIYSLFHSKSDIHAFVIHQLAKQKVNEIEKKIEQYKSSTEQLEQLVFIAIVNRREKIKARDISLIDAHEREMHFNIFSEAFAKLFRKVIQQGMDTNEFRVGNIDIVLLYIGGIMRSSIDYMDENKEYPIENDAKAAVIKLLT